MSPNLRLMARRETTTLAELTLFYFTLLISRLFNCSVRNAVKRFLHGNEQMTKAILSFQILYLELSHYEYNVKIQLSIKLYRLAKLLICMDWNA